MSKRNQTSASRISTRYYESAFAGKFKGLKPGTLDAETRKLLGLGVINAVCCLLSEMKLKKK